MHARTQDQTPDLQTKPLSPLRLEEIRPKLGVFDYYALIKPPSI